jgi:hypothetical protein
MPRRLLALLALLSAFMVVACQGAPAVPALTDPKEILSRSLASIATVKTIELSGTFNGSVKAAELGGSLDLSTIKLNAALDVANKKAKFLLDAPTILGTKVEALLIDQVAYLKIAGPLAAMAGATADKYTKTEIPDSTSDPVANATDISKTVADLKAALDQLPAPTKGADERCGDQDCYRVTLKLTAADVQRLNPSAASIGSGDMTMDIWSRKNDLRPAKIALSVATPDAGTFGATFELKYDGAVSIDAPSADQVAP